MYRMNIYVKTPIKKHFVMTREQELTEALQTLIHQTRQAMLDEQIYTNDFKKELSEAQAVLNGPDQTSDWKYSSNTSRACLVRHAG